jgi:hypothetical protein
LTGKNVLPESYPTNTQLDLLTNDVVNTRNKDILVIDTGGGNISTVTKRVCLVLQQTNHFTDMVGYQDKSEPCRLPIVHCAIKENFPDKENPVIFILNYVTLLDDPDELEPLLQPFACMRHGISVDLTPQKHGGRSGIRVDGDYFPFEYDDEKLFIRIQQETWEDLENYDCYELTSPHDDAILQNVNSRRTKKKLTHEEIPLVK